MRKYILLIFMSFLIFCQSFGQSNFEWPESPSGHVFKNFLKAYNSGISLEIEDFVKKNYANTSEDKVNEATEYWMDLFYRFGQAKPYSLSINKPNDLEVWLQGTISKTWFAPEFILNKETGKVKAVGLLLGEQPPNTSNPALTSEEFFRRLNNYLRENEKNGLFQGAVLVSMNEQIVINKGYGLKNMEEGVNNDSNTRFDIASVTKPITAIAVLQLVQNGLLDLYTPIKKYLPELPESISSKINIYQLLTHTSDYKLKGIEGFREEIVKTNSLKEVYQIHQEYLPKWDKFEDFTPTGKWNYSNQGYDLLGIIIENVTQLTFEDYLKKNIFNVAGMPDTSFSNENTAQPYRYDLKHNGLKNYSEYPPFFGKVSAAAQLKSTTDDLANLFKSIKNTDLLLDDEYKNLLFSPAVKKGGSNYQSLGLKIGYEPVPYIGHGGVNVGNTSELYYFPDSDLFVVILCNNRSGAPNVFNFIKNNVPKMD